ncbi:MBL fold metallo-hydrolase [Lysinibacillus capsici]|uniref:MBL fold metallo-hydrolase n=1 Tax=Lysinibacillus capsici TaxID=2115968 RepID=A0ABY8KP64_9BACI|nr:MBL fold metallo-hydrolase [Lysinibacillus capsici]MDP1392749.1 MBL fold metallo-hydrolase [Lysinibacillus capsici]MDP1413224.1 MBL fold metallo-hydrolase [Lysinibacillus capsici]MDP1428142.1 MBL fold metallo-hydrolase [Lysinibacillus capsici]WGF39450.1 MBL fold metallo-hydrolase [Lysinibacillus capsici]
MDKNLNYGEDYKFIPATSVGSGVGIDILPDLYQYTIQIVNIVLYGEPQMKDFVLIDAGMPKSADEIISVVEERYGSKSRPKAIILTHGHFDHVGGIIELIERWGVPVYAHTLEIPFLSGKQNYPEPDPTVNNGLVAKMSPIFPNEAINLGGNLKVLPSDGSVPFMAGFRWIHTPGHSPGHISLFREKDKVLIAGDAFVTVKQESLYKVITQTKEISGPPQYFTTDWLAARASIEKLAILKPSVAITGHGLPMKGEELTSNLKKLVDDFEQIALPKQGKYLN